MKTKLIFNSFLAKQLVLKNNTIIDLIKDHKRNNEVVFVFEDTEKLINDMEEINKKI